MLFLTISFFLLVFMAVGLTIVRGSTKPKPNIAIAITLLIKAVFLNTRKNYCSMFEYLTVLLAVIVGVLAVTATGLSLLGYVSYASQASALAFGYTSVAMLSLCLMLAFGPGGLKGCWMVFFVFLGFAVVFATCAYVIGFDIDTSFLTVCDSSMGGGVMWASACICGLPEGHAMGFADEDGNKPCMVPLNGVTQGLLHQWCDLDELMDSGQERGLESYVEEVKARNAKDQAQIDSELFEQAMRRLGGVFTSNV